MNRMSNVLGVGLVGSAIVYRDYQKKNRIHTTVVGGGITGLSAARSLAQSGVIVHHLARGYADGSSMKGRRICGLSAYSKPADLENLDQSITEWKALGTEPTGKIFYDGPGLLIVRQRGSETEKQFMEAAKHYPDRIIALSQEDASTRFPQFKFGPTDSIFLDTRGGFIESDVAIEAVKASGSAHGVTYTDRCEYRDYQLVNTVWGPRVRTTYLFNGTEQSLYSKTLVLALGRDATPLIAQLGGELRTNIQGPGHLTPPAQSPMLTTGIMPPYSWTTPMGISFYGFPKDRFDTLRIGGYKLKADVTLDGHSVSNMTSRVTGDGDHSLDFEHTTRAFEWFSRNHIPTTIDAASDYGCHTTFLENKLGQRYDSPIIGALPGSNGKVIVFAGCMGKSFKYAPSHGAAIRDLVISGTLPKSMTSYDINRYLNWLGPRH